MDSFLKNLHLVKIHWFQEDWMTWILCKAQYFTIRTYYRTLRIGGDQSFPW